MAPSRWLLSCSCSCCKCMALTAAACMLMHVSAWQQGQSCSRDRPCSTTAQGGIFPRQEALARCLDDRWIGRYDKVLHGHTHRIQFLAQLASCPPGEAAMHQVQVHELGEHRESSVVYINGCNLITTIHSVTRLSCIPRIRRVSASSGTYCSSNVLSVDRVQVECCLACAVCRRQ